MVSGKYVLKDSAHTQKEAKLYVFSSTEPESHGQTTDAPLKTTSGMSVFHWNQIDELVKLGRNTVEQLFARNVYRRCVQFS